MTLSTTPMANTIATAKSRRAVTQMRWTFFPYFARRWPVRRDPETDKVSRTVTIVLLLDFVAGATEWVEPVLVEPVVVAASMIAISLDAPIR